MEKKKFEAKGAKKKTRELEKLKELMRSYPVFGLLDMTDLPALQLIRIKHSLRSSILIKMSKKRLLKIAFNELKSEKKGIDTLIDKLKGLPAIVFTKEEPFKLAKLISQNKSMAPAKPGQTAPTDLIVPAGPTPFPAGPMIGELGAMGIKCKVENGKISVINATTLVKEGEVIVASKAGLLSKLGIEPMEIGLNLLLTYKDGEILTKEVLFVDEQEYLDNIARAASEAFALSLSIGYITEDNIKVLLSKANAEATSLAKKANIMTSENVGEQLAKAEAQAESLENSLPEVKIEEKKETIKEEPKPIEKPKVEEKPAEEFKIESKKEITLNEMDQAKNKLQELVDKKIKGEI